MNKYQKLIPFRNMYITVFAERAAAAMGITETDMLKAALTGVMFSTNKYQMTFQASECDLQLHVIGDYTVEEVIDDIYESKCSSFQCGPVKFSTTREDLLQLEAEGCSSRITVEKTMELMNWLEENFDVQ